MRCCRRGAANAFYASASTPSNVTSALGKVMVKAGAADVSFGAGASAGIRSSVPAVTNVGGRALSVPVAYRFAPAAARVAAAYAFGAPGIMIGGAMALGYAYYTAQGFQVDQGVWKKRIDGEECASNCFEYRVSYFGGAWSKSVSGAANAWAVTVNDANNTYAFVSADPDGNGFTGNRSTKSNVWNYETNSPMPDTVTPFHKELDKRAIAPYNTSSMTPVSQAEFEGTMAPLPLPSGVAQELGIPLPVEEPILNPTIARTPLHNPCACHRSTAACA